MRHMPNTISLMDGLMAYVSIGPNELEFTRISKVP